ncbi:MAG: hypothetical protein AAFV29_17225, partial [Myxococcota bacterium]
TRHTLTPSSQPMMQKHNVSAKSWSRPETSSIRKLSRFNDRSAADVHIADPRPPSFPGNYL